MRLTLHSLRASPSSLFARIALIMLAGLLATQLISVWLQTGERANVVSQARGQNFADRMVEAIRVLEAAGASRRDVTLAALQSRSLQVEPIADEEVVAHVPRGQIRAQIAARLGSERELRAAGSAMGMPQRGNMMRSFDVRLVDGQWVRITTLLDPSPPALPGVLISQLLSSLAIVIVVVMIAVRQVSQPLRQLADAADSLGCDLNAPALPERGPAETRRAAQAFNRMQARIRHLVDERARALAAVSHDLRTPLTRLRLRAELVDDESLREQMGADLDAMAAMLNATLDYLRGLQDSEAPRRIDMNALLQSMVEDAALIGQQVDVAGEALSPYAGRLSALRRALQNLIDNAIKYGRRAHVAIHDSPFELRIVVEDEGPGIAPEELARVTEAYYRPDVARNSETGGVGLGLSIAKDIALMHGGELLLSNRAGGGLSAALVLPRKAPG